MSKPLPDVRVGDVWRIGMWRASDARVLDRAGSVLGVQSVYHDPERCEVGMAEFTKIRRLVERDGKPVEQSSCDEYVNFGDAAGQADERANTAARGGPLMLDQEIRIAEPRVSDALGDRMKRYERAAKTALPWRMPVVVRVDGRAFHTYTKGCVRPFDESLISAMNACAMAICEDAQGAAVAYVQSDEISVLLHGYRKLDSQPWFENEVQKIVSISASIAAATMTAPSPSIFGEVKRASFDARVFALPEAEVCNYFIWRQQDATRNAIQMMSHALYSHKELHRKNTSEMQDMLHAKGINFNDAPTCHKRGRCVLRRTFELDGATRHHWIVDNEIPIFTKDRAYIERHLAVENEA